MLPSPPPSVRADDVRRDMRQKKRNRDAVYDSVVSLIHRAILKRADVGGVRMFYDVPLIVVGKPVVKVGECVRHVLASLQADGYTVRLTPPKTVYVSWDADERRSYPKLTGEQIDTIADGVNDVYTRRSDPRAAAGAAPGTGPVQNARTAPPPAVAAPVVAVAIAPPAGQSAPTKCAPPDRAARGGFFGNGPDRFNGSNGANCGFGGIGGFAGFGDPPAVAGDLLPWEAFEQSQPMRSPGLSLLAPPQMTVTRVCEVPRPAAAAQFQPPAPSAAPPHAAADAVRSMRARLQSQFSAPGGAPFPPGPAGVSVERVGPNGGLVLNL